MSVSTITVEGREFSVKVLGAARFETVLSSYGEVTLTGVRGAEYLSERWHGTTVFRFWKNSSRSGLPTPAFRENLYFTFEGDTLRPATYHEAKAALATFYAR